MKANLKKMLGLAALGMTLLSNTVPTWAGNLYPKEVIIGNGTGYQYAGGSLSATRDSIDPQKSIGCSIYASPLVVCQARTTNNFLGCYSYDTRLIASVQSMTDSSYIYFQVKNGDTACTQITISNDSRVIK